MIYLRLLICIFAVQEKARSLIALHECHSVCPSCGTLAAAPHQLNPSFSISSHRINSNRPINSIILCLTIFKLINNAIVLTGIYMPHPMDRENGKLETTGENENNNNLSIQTIGDDWVSQLYCSSVMLCDARLLAWQWIINYNLCMVIRNRKLTAVERYFCFSSYSVFSCFCKLPEKRLQCMKWMHSW